MKNRRKGKYKYPSPEVYDHERFKPKKVTLKDKNIWYLIIAVTVLTVVYLTIITL
jgi:hypothetical protein